MPANRLEIVCATLLKSEFPRIRVIIITITGNYNGRRDAGRALQVLCDTERAAVCIAMADGRTSKSSYFFLFVVAGKLNAASGAVRFAGSSRLLVSIY